MADPLVTLTTDFGTASPYVAAMKGVLLAVNPAVRLVDLSHDIPPQNVRHAAFFLASALPYFPADTLHVVVVDPGVGSERVILYVETAGQRLLVPDNGCWTLLEEPRRVLRVAEPRFWRSTVSSTFHGRDIFAPVAAHLARGVNPEQLGPAVSEWVRLEMRPPVPGMNSLTGEIVFIDHFGNLITNIPAARLQTPNVLTVGRHTFRRRFRWVRTYAEAEPGTLVALASSTDLLEVAVVQGNAAHRLQATIGTPVTVGWTR
jgi:S-adenosylmethionine hydrolase